MIIWTSNRSLILGLPLVLAGCLNSQDVTKRDFSLNRPVPDTIAVANQSVVIGGPPGYCIDKGASRLGGDTAFVLLGSCASIARNVSAGAPTIPGILTASVTRDGNTDVVGPVALERYILSPDGAAALARDGRAGSVEILGTLRENGAVFIQLKDTSPNDTPGLADTYWRALFNLNGRLITASVVSFSDKPLSAQAGADTLRAFLARIRRETPSGIATLDPQQ